MVDNLLGNFNLSELAISLAQHYGLPSVGLDATTDIDVALFFALHEFRDDPSRPGWQTCVRKAAGADLSVLYVLN